MIPRRQCLVRHRRELTKAIAGQPHGPQAELDLIEEAIRRLLVQPWLQRASRLAMDAVYETLRHDGDPLFVRSALHLVSEGHIRTWRRPAFVVPLAPVAQA